MLNMCSGVALLLAKIDVFYPKEISHNPPTIMSNLSFLAAAEQIICRTSPLAASDHELTKLGLLVLKRRSVSFNPLTATVGYTRHDADVICSTCSASRLVQAKSLKVTSVFLKEEKICNKMVYYTLHLSLTNRQKSCCKVRIYTDEKVTFLKGA